MKFFLLVFTVSFAISVQAQDNSEFKAETIQFIKLTGATQAFEDAIDQLGSTVPQEKKADYKKEAMGTLSGLYDEMSVLYMAEFTRGEIKELIQFYNTPIGKKLASKQSLMAQRAMMMGQNWAMKVQGVAQKYN